MKLAPWMVIREGKCVQGIERKDLACGSLHHLGVIPEGTGSGNPAPARNPYENQRGEIVKICTLCGLLVCNNRKIKED